MDKIQFKPQNLFSKFTKVKNHDVDTSEGIQYGALYDGIPNEFKIFAEKELKETDEKISKGMKFLRKFLEDKNLPDACDLDLIIVLRNCKYDLKKSKGKLEKFMRARKAITRSLAGLDLKKADLIIKDNCFGVLPYRDKHGRLVCFTRPNVNLDLYDMEEAAACFFAFLLYLLSFPMTSICGNAYIAETKCPSVSLMYTILMTYKNHLRTLVDLPLSLRRIDIINESFLVRWFYGILRPLVPAKIYQRIFFHGDQLQNLQKYYHPDMLPDQFGGNMGPITSKLFRDELIDFIRNIQDEQNMNHITDQ